MRLILCFLIISCLWSVEQFQLKDGTIIKGDRLSETETTIEVQTSFGIITINKGDLLLKVFKITLNSGEIFIGEKVFEDDSVLKLQTQNLGEIELEKSNILSIIESEAITESPPPNIVNQPYQYRYSNPFYELLFGESRLANKNLEFSLGEEQLIDLFFFPTGYTLEQGTLYLSGLSFGFGVTEKFQITTNWWGFFSGDLNLRPKYQLFEKGNWEKQQALSVGAHYHTQWRPNKFEWKNGEITILPDGYNGATNWGGFYPFGEDPDYNIEEYYDETHVNRSDNSEYELVEMIEVFGAFTYSKAREGLRGRISHSAGGNLQYVNSKSPKTFYSVYYGIDVDINNRLKMIGSIFYDPSYIESSDDYYEIGDLSASPVVKEEIDPIHFDFGFIYAINEKFRFGIHFQPYVFAFYWKF